MRFRFILILLTIAATSGCSVRKFAINKIGDALAQGGSTYESDDDLELVQGALPFGLKLVETMLEESPKHRGLLFAAAQGFTSYAYLAVQQDMERAKGKDYEAWTSLIRDSHRNSPRLLDRPSQGSARKTSH